MPETISMRQLLASGAFIAPHEAIAIVQQLLQNQWDGDADRGFQLDDLKLSDDGNVQHPPCQEPKECEIGRLLDSMLGAASGHRVPGALRLAVARACRALDAPPFGSLAALSHSLERFAGGDGHEVVRGLVSRALTPAPATSTESEPMRAATPSAMASSPIAVVEPSRPERRRSAIGVSAVRRDLREADARLFKLQMQLAAVQSQVVVSESPSPRMQSRIAVFIAAVLLSFMAGYAGMTLLGTQASVQPAAPGVSRRTASAPDRPQLHTVRGGAAASALEASDSITPEPPTVGTGFDPHRDGSPEDEEPAAAGR